LSMMQDIINSFSDKNLDLESFFKQIQKSFDDIIKNTSQVQDNLLSNKNEIDATLTQIQLELKNNQSLLEKWVSGENKLQQEQISQKKIWLLESHKTLQDNVNQFFVDIDKNIKDFSTASHQFIIDYKNLENQMKAYTNELALGLNQDLGYAPQSDAISSVSKALQEAVDALNAVQNGLEQRKAFDDIKKTIDSIIQ
jgi:ABC-type transporter Mla subunit MlaD